MGELDAGEVVETVEPEVLEQPDTEPAEDATPASPDDPQGSKGQAVDKDKVLADYAYKARQAHRENEELKRRLDELEKSKATPPPVVPELPDPIAVDDATYRKALVDRDNAIRQSAQWEQQQREAQAKADAARQEQERQRQAEFSRAAETYAKRAPALGVKPEELAMLGNYVAGFGIRDELTEVILADDHGPLITKYLASNPAELQQLVDMPPARAAYHLATVVKGKAAALKPKVTAAPDPADPVRNAGSVQPQRGPKGATYE